MVKKCGSNNLKTTRKMFKSIKLFKTIRNLNNLKIIKINLLFNLKYGEHALRITLYTSGRVSSSFSHQARFLYTSDVFISN